MNARYVFRVRFRLSPTRDVTVDPAEFETRLYRPADSPGEEGWLFFRDNLWRGRLGDVSHFREITADALSVPVVSVSYRAFETDAAYLAALKEEIAANLDLFKANDVTEVITKYLGSSIEVRD